MGRAAKHNWKKLYLEYCQGRYKSVAEFARKKGINPNQMRDGFRKAKNQGEEPEKTTDNNRNKQQKTTGKNAPKKGTTEKLHPWEYLKQQFTDWPEEKLQAYLIQLEARKAELESVPFEELTQAEVKELGQVRRERRAILSDPDPERICAAHNRDGSPCGNPAERGKRTCWNHGGAPGSGPPKGSQNNLRHGFYARIMPDDPEIMSIIEEIDAKSPLEMLWDQIVLQYAAIARAQRIMYVRDKEEMIKELKRSYEKSTVRRTEKTSTNSDECEYEYEFQFAWDRQATFLTAQSKAMVTLEKLIARYEAMANDEQKLKLAKLKQDMEIDRERLQLEKSRVLGDPDETEDDGFIDALRGKAGEAWDEYSDNGSTGDAETDSEEAED